MCHRNCIIIKIYIISVKILLLNNNNIKMTNYNTVEFKISCLLRSEVYNSYMVTSNPEYR
jgi:hypothetical protein